MSLEKRDILVGHIVERQPALRKFLSKSEGCIIQGSWDLVSFSFQEGFEAMWDLARASNSGLLTMPLLSLWRQSIELALKSAIIEIVGSIENNPTHNLQKLFMMLKKVSTEKGLNQNDDLTRNVEAMIKEVQSFDRYADRFRYPTGRKNTPYEGIKVDLDDLFQAHWIIVTWCEGTVVELREEFGIGTP